jgi:hypothetical protein
MVTYYDEVRNSLVRLQTYEAIFYLYAYYNFAVLSLGNTTGFLLLWRIVPSRTEQGEKTRPSVGRKPNTPRLSRLSNHCTKHENQEQQLPECIYLTQPRRKKSLK